MSKFHSYLNNAIQIIEMYKGDMPLSHFLKQYFSANKKFGSKDRKKIAALCYQYFRVANAVDGTVAEKIIAGEFLCNQDPSEFISLHQPVWKDSMHMSLKDKLQLLKIDVQKLFPLHRHLSKEFNPIVFASSFLMQPDVFLRVRPGKKTIVEKALTTSAVQHEWVEKDIARIPSTTNTKMLLHLNRDAVIQDINSTKVFSGIEKILPEVEVFEVWDCCAASGGKSILLYDVLKGRVRLSVTDIRKSILQNLKERLQQARVPVYASAIADLTNDADKQNDSYHIVVCDAPCSGSGTWARTPEQMHFINESLIEKYAERQQEILQHIWPNVKQGGILYYITCSVFTKENEEVVHQFEQATSIKHISMQYFKGYEMKADTLFCAVFKKSTSQ